jgi:hypothetical protein
MREREEEATQVVRLTSGHSSLFLLVNQVLLSFTRKLKAWFFKMMGLTQRDSILFIQQNKRDDESQKAEVEVERGSSLCNSFSFSLPFDRRPGGIVHRVSQGISLRDEKSVSSCGSIIL